MKLRFSLIIGKELVNWSLITIWYDFDADDDIDGEQLVFLNPLLTGQRLSSFSATDIVYLHTLSTSYSLLCNVICFTQLDDVNSIGWEADSSWISITLRRRWELVTTNVCQPTNRFLPRFDKGKAIDWVGEGSPKGRHRPNDHHKMPRKRKRRKSIRWSFSRTPQRESWQRAKKAMLE